MPAGPPNAGRFSRRSVLAGAVAVPIAATPIVAVPFAASAAASTPTTARVEPAAAASALDPAPAPAQTGGTLRRVTIYAERLPDSPPGTAQYGYGLAPGQATIPGPVLEMWEGDTLEIELVNRTDQRLSIHPHGVNYDVNSDGSPFNDSFNDPGETRIYTWRTQTSYESAGRWMPGSAGYWHYHDHALGGDHGTAGVAGGLYGALVVRRRGDLLPDRQFTVVFNELLLNNKMAPDTPIFECNQGQRVEFICIGHGNQLHTWHLHAHRWAKTRTGYLSSANDPTPVVDNQDLNPGSSFGFQVLAGAGVGPGAWMYHCHVQFHSDGGMSGVFLVRNPDGSMPPGAQETIDRWRTNHAAGTTHGTTATAVPAATDLGAPAGHGHG